MVRKGRQRGFVRRLGANEGTTAVAGEPKGMGEGAETKSPVSSPSRLCIPNNDRSKQKHAPSRLPLLLSRRLRLGPIKHLQELSHTLPHPRVHVSLGALDVVVKVVAEELDLGDGRKGDFGGRKVAGEED